MGLSSIAIHSKHNLGTDIYDSMTLIKPYFT